MENQINKHMTKKQRENRVIARGEVSGHSHIITGEATIERKVVEKKETVIIHAGKNCAIKHLLEKPFVEEGKEIWTQEHKDISLREGKSYEYVQQIEYDPYAKAIQNVKD